MLNLPTELIQLLDDGPSSLVNLALVNRYYNCIVTPILYGKVTLEGLPKILAFADTMLNGRTQLCEYSKFLSICHYPHSFRDESGDLKLTVKKLLMHLPNLKTLFLKLRRASIRYVLENPHFPFELQNLSMIPPRDTLFVDFLKTQPSIENITLLIDHERPFCLRPKWTEVSIPLERHILPNLKTINSDEADICFLSPSRPVASVIIKGHSRNLGTHAELAKSSAPLGYLSECIRVWNHPWEDRIVSHCFPSLEFARESLKEYSLGIFVCGISIKLNPSNPGLLLTAEDIARGLRSIRDCLSSFSKLRKFSLPLSYRHIDDLPLDLCCNVPGLSRFDWWHELCPSLEEITVFRVTLKK
ncbi:hypothetical protein RhiXN_03505 [Rhizoctonia solani]|uniref:Uncharacterized protein n=1 Tax=Rhizoctonia solani TaxID=456999 RepID=A0A8H8SU63_9AGAM|nr:uncharacterized protein RhiXN_03505 [Rhizoctonia solani]QRW18581.1 hypothetical protein RhiXN_03505 [Rhizoctonia solani]